MTKVRRNDKITYTNKNKRGKRMNTLKKVVCLILAVCALGILAVACDTKITLMPYTVFVSAMMTVVFLGAYFIAKISIDIF